MNQRQRGDKARRDKTEQLSKTRELTEQLSKTCELAEQLSSAHSPEEQLGNTRTFIGRVDKADNPELSINMEAPHGNTWSTYTAVFTYYDKPAPTVIGRPGLYDVMITLMHPTTSIFRTSLPHNPDGIMGNSLLILDQDMEIMVSMPQGNHEFLLLRNPQGYLGLIKFKIDASNFFSAEMQGMDVAQPFLSLLSVQYNVSLSAHAITVVENSTGAVSLSAGVSGKEKRLSIEKLNGLPIVTELPIAKVFSAYREALNAQDPFHKIISLWRVFEGLQRVRELMRNSLPVEKRKDLFPKSKLPVLVEDVPEPYRTDLRHGWLELILGKSHQEAVEQFTDDHRNAIAHMKFENNKDGTGKPVLVADTWRDVISCWYTSQIIEYVLRDYLKLTLSAYPKYSSFELTEI